MQFTAHQKISSNRSRLFLCELMLIMYAIHLTGCATVETPAIEQPVVEDKSNVVIEEQQRVIENQQQKIEELELLLTKKNVELKQKNIREKEQDQVIQAASNEITRTQIKLHRLATKSSSASLIAEAEVAMVALKSRSISESDAQLKIQAQLLLDAAEIYFSQDDYASATHYASQSVEFINMIADPNRELPNRPTVAFNSPIRLQTTADANLRHAPGTRSAIIVVLNKDAYLTATAYQGNWLRVQTDNNLQGWVSNALIKVLVRD